jgi:hypothetical protein
MLGSATSAQAQMLAWEDFGYAAFNFGLQAGTQQFEEISSPLIYGETATIVVPHEVTGGAFIDFAGGIRVWRNLAIGIGYTSSGDSEEATLLAQIPNPAFFNQPRSATAPTGEMEHHESAVHLQFLWMFPITNEFELAAVVGPSFYSIKQDFVSNLGITEGAPPYTTVTISSVELTEESERATGFTFGLDGTYLFTPNVGAGAFLRYSSAEAEMQTSGGIVTVEAGGFQFGFGARFRF